MRVRYTFRLSHHPEHINWSTFLLNADAETGRGVVAGRVGWTVNFEGIHNRTRFLREFGQYACGEVRQVLLGRD